MATSLRHTIRSRRIQVAILVILLSILAVLILSFVEKIQSVIEQYGLKTSIYNIKNIVVLQGASFSSQGIKDCPILDNPRLFFPLINSPPTVTAGLFSEQRKALWEYDVKKRRLIYSVRATHYFKSNIGPRIEIDLICKDGLILLKISPYHWCQDWSIWSC